MKSSHRLKNSGYGFLQREDFQALVADLQPMPDLDAYHRGLEESYRCVITNLESTASVP